MAHYSVIMYWRMNCSSTITKTFVYGLEANPGKLKFNIRSEKTMGVYDEDGR